MNEDAIRLVQIEKGLRYGRVAGLFLGGFLAVMGLVTLFSNAAGFHLFKANYFIAYGILLTVPYGRLSDAFWKVAFTVLAVFSGLFVFVMVAHVMFAYMAAAEIGEKLGVPGLEGSLIFLGLLQVPVVLFQRKPDLLD